MKTTAIVGSMFSGKSTLLNKQIREVRRHEKFYVMVFKPRIDDRYDAEAITTHDQTKEKTTLLVDDAAEIWSYYQNIKEQIDSSKKVICFIDEVQFLEAVTLIDVIRKLNKDNVEVITAGLDMDKFGNPFGATPSVLAIADEVVKLKTKCACGNDSYTQLSITANPNIIDIGSDTYTPVCKRCFFEHFES